MEVGPVSRSIAISAPEPVRADVPASVPDAVTTQLPADLVVTASRQSVGLPSDAANRAAGQLAQQRTTPADDPSRRTLDRDVFLDRATGELVVRMIDRSNGETVSQVPEDELLRLRAYMRSLFPQPSLADMPRVKQTA